MKKAMLILSAWMLLSCASHAQDHGFGLGVVIGDPTGISAKLWMTRQTALQFGFSLSDNFKGSRALMSADYLWHSFDLIRSTERLPVYYGVGGALSSGGGGDAALGVRGVFGVVWLPRTVPIDVFFQVVPTVTIVPASSFGIGAGVGVRFFFG
ncbi:MAG: hypothetical protein HY562_03340 [Ignavibacteriales bacterium]|nr:hypothetical protein [Ignavibacteriales bacterium]